MNKKIMSTILIVSIAAALGGGCNAATNDIKVTYDGKEIEFDVQPIIENDRVMVPMRQIFEEFGAKVKWDSETQTITSKKKSKTITMTIGSTDMTKNEETYTFDTAPEIKEGRTLVPIRAVSDLLGLNVEWDSDSQSVIITTPPDDASENLWEENTGTIDLDNMTVTGDGISVNENIITISKGGDFTVTGTLEDGQIVIDTEEKAKLRLSGMSLTNTKGAAIYIKNAEKAYITVTENTENYLTDGEEYTSGDENEKACITARDNLEFKGNGTLTVNGNYNHGIDGSDSIEIGNGNITVNAKNDGIHTNDTLEITGGTVNINAEGDGLQADEIVDITGGEINVTTTGEVQASESFGGSMFRPTGDPTQMTEEERQSMREEMESQFAQYQAAEIESDNSEDITSKGIKADWMLDISGGTVNVNSTDHAIHCASDIKIKGGDITLTSQVKKGISAHGNVIIDDGIIDIKKSTEGIESKQILTINGGDINIEASSDDGLNAGGNGNDDMFGFGGRGQMTPPEGDTTGTEGMARPEDMTPPEGDTTGTESMARPEGMTPPNGENGEGMTPPEGVAQPPQNNRPQGSGMGRTETDEISTEHHIQINGGNLYINAQGDGIDSNGSLVIDGGNVVIDGTTSGGDSALDSDGAIMVNGGTLTAVSALGMVEAPNSYSKQNVLNISLSQSYEAGQEISIKTSSGEEVVSFTPAKSYQSFIYSSDKIKTGEEYTLYVAGEEVESFTVSEVVTNVGNADLGMNRPGGRKGQMNNTETAK